MLERWGVLVYYIPAAMHSCAAQWARCPRHTGRYSSSVCRRIRYAIALPRPLQVSQGLCQLGRRCQAERDSDRCPDNTFLTGTACSCQHSLRRKQREQRILSPAATIQPKVCECHIFASVGGD